MVRVGLNASGASTAGVSTVRGIYDNGTTAGGNFYHNSVYLGGTQSFAFSTFAFVSTGATIARTFQNNIFVNARSRIASTALATKLSTITITDGGNGTNTLSLSGTDASSFEIIAGKLRLKAGETLDFETKSSYSVRVNVDDTTVGGTPDAFADFTLSITNVTELTGIDVNGDGIVNVADTTLVTRAFGRKLKGGLLRDD